MEHGVTHRSQAQRQCPEATVEAYFPCTGESQACQRVANLACRKASPRPTYNDPKKAEIKQSERLARSAMGEARHEKLSNARNRFCLGSFHTDSRPKTLAVVLVMSKPEAVATHLTVGPLQSMSCGTDLCHASSRGCTPPSALRTGRVSPADDHRNRARGQGFPSDRCFTSDHSCPVSRHGVCC
jgi:hypothetical protein